MSALPPTRPTRRAHASRAAYHAKQGFKVQAWVVAVPALSRDLRSGAPVAYTNRSGLVSYCKNAGEARLAVWPELADVPVGLTPAADNCCRLANNDHESVGFCRPTGSGVHCQVRDQLTASYQYNTIYSYT